MINVRTATMDHDQVFAELLLLSAPYFPGIFGNGIEMALRKLFRHPSNLFSFEHVLIAEVDEKPAGMILGYDWHEKKGENLATGLLLFRYAGYHLLKNIMILLKFNRSVGEIREDDFYISNVATFSQYRSMGVGNLLILEAEKVAKMVDAKNMVLDVESDNAGAVRLYENMGYEVVKEHSIKIGNSRSLHFKRMVKSVI